MKEIVSVLEEIEKSARTGDTAKIAKAIQLAQSKLTVAGEAPLRQLNEELSVWQKKLDVILKEPVAREGMAKHARHWIEQIKKIGG